MRSLYIVVTIIVAVFSAMPSQSAESFKPSFRSRPAALPGEEGLTPLMIAVRRGNVEDVKRQIAAGENVNAQLKDTGTTALHMAVILQREEIVRTLIAASANVQTAATTGETALHHAVSRGNTKIIRQLIDAGANVNTQMKPEYGGYTPLLATVLAPNSVEAARLLLDAGANINAWNNDQLTPLMAAAAFGNYELVQLLLTRGAKTDLKSLEGKTAAAMAASSGNSNIVKLLKSNPTK